MLDGGTRIGRYQVVARLGAGGMGEVYRVRDLRLGREVALKVIADGVVTNAQSLARFEQEARLAGALEHPNVLAVHDVGDHDGKPYLVSELLEGETLRARLSRGPLPALAAMDIALQVAHGLEAAQAKGIVHRDLKPENVFITRSGRVKILDFGIAKLLPEVASRTATDGLQPLHTRTGAMVGTASYMSPEQVRGEPIDGRSDLFSLGCVVYEMLSGRRPFAGNTAMETGAAILYHDPSPLPADVPASLRGTVARCLAKQASARWASAAELIAALQACAVSDETALPAPAQAPAPRSRRALWTAGAVFVVAAAGVVAWALAARNRSAAALAARPSVAVLPFADLSPQKDQEFFSDGVAEEILNALAHLEGLHVAGRTSSFSFKGKNEDLRTVGQKLNVAHVLEGSVRKDGRRVRVTAQLVDVGDGYHLWSETYDRDLTDIFAVQDEIARSVVEALRVKLLSRSAPSTRGHRTSNTEVYSRYLIGQQLLERRSGPNSADAIDAFDKALALDPGYAPAWAALGIALTDLDALPGTAKDLEVARQRALAAAEKAVALDPEAAETHAARSHVRASLAWDWAGAQADVERAVAINPGDASTQRIAGRLAAALGRFDDAVAALQRATEIDPLDARAWMMLGRVHQIRGRMDLAQRAFDHLSEITPDSERAPFSRGTHLLLQRRPHEGLQAYLTISGGPFRLFGLALAWHDLGNAKESESALQALQEQYKDSAAYKIAMIHAWRGERDEAFRWLERAYQLHNPHLMDLRISSVMRRAYDDPRFGEMLRRMNLPPD